MRRSPFTRFVAALAGGLLLQLSLLGSGTLCRMQSDARATMGMDMMDMSAAGTTHMHVGASDMAAVTTAPAPCHTTGTCDAPWSPDAGCSSMATCITAVSATLIQGSASLATVRDRVAVVRSVDMPLGPAFAPELPPPRA